MKLQHLLFVAIVTFLVSCSTTKSTTAETNNKVAATVDSPVPPPPPPPPPPAPEEIGTPCFKYVIADNMRRGPDFKAVSPVYSITCESAREVSIAQFGKDMSKAGHNINVYGKFEVLHFSSKEEATNDRNRLVEKLSSRNVEVIKLE